MVFRIKELREAAGYSQRELGRIALVSWYTISAIEERKSKNPSAMVLYRIAKALGVTMEDLIERDEVHLQTDPDQMELES